MTAATARLQQEYQDYQERVFFGYPGREPVSIEEFERILHRADTELQDAYQALADTPPVVWQFAGYWHAPSAAALNPDAYAIVREIEELMAL